MSQLNLLRVRVKEAGSREEEDSCEVRPTPRFYSNDINQEEQEARTKAMEQSAMTSMPFSSSDSSAVPEAKAVSTSEMAPKKETEMTITVRKKEAQSLFSQRVKQAEEEEPYSAHISQLPAYMTIGGGLGYGAGTISALKRQAELAEELGGAQKAEELLKTVSDTWKQHARGRSFDDFMRDIAHAPEHVKNQAVNLHGKHLDYLRASKAVPQLTKEIGRTGLLRKALGVGGGLATGVLLATALGAFDKKKRQDARAIEEPENKYRDFGKDDAQYAFLEQ